MQNPQLAATKLVDLASVTIYRRDQVVVMSPKLAAIAAEIDKVTDLDPSVRRKTSLGRFAGFTVWVVA